MTFILSQVFICISAVIYSISLILKTKQKMLFLQLFSSVFYISHYFLLNAKLAGLVAIVETIRLLVFFFIDKNDKLNIVWVRVLACLSFSILSLVCAVFTWNGIYCILPLIATIIVNVTLSFKNVIFYKVGAMVYACLIISYLFLIGSTLGGISQIVALIFSIVGILMEIKNIKKNENVLSSQQQQILENLTNFNASENDENKKISL